MGIDLLYAPTDRVEPVLWGTLARCVIPIFATAGPCSLFGQDLYFLRTQHSISNMLAANNCAGRLSLVSGLLIGPHFAPFVRHTLEPITSCGWAKSIISGRRRGSSVLCLAHLCSSSRRGTISTFCLVTWPSRVRDDARVNELEAPQMSHRSPDISTPVSSKITRAAQLTLHVVCTRWHSSRYAVPRLLAS